MTRFISISVFSLLLAALAVLALASAIEANHVHLDKVIQAQLNNSLL